MTDTGQIPGEGLPESAGMVEQPGVHAQGAYAYAGPSAAPAEEDDLLLMPGAQGAWMEGQLPPGPPGPAPGAHERSGRDSGALDMSARTPAAAHSAAPRRPLHSGPPASPVRSLADRGPAAQPAPVTTPGPATGPEYLDIPQEDPAGPGDTPPQGAVPWTPEGLPQDGGHPEGPQAAAAETVVPDASHQGAAYPGEYPAADYQADRPGGYQGAEQGTESGQFAYPEGAHGDAALGDGTYGDAAYADPAFPAHGDPALNGHGDPAALNGHGDPVFDGQGDPAFNGHVDPAFHGQGDAAFPGAREAAFPVQGEPAFHGQAPAAPQDNAGFPPSAGAFDAAPQAGAAPAGYAPVPETPAQGVPYGQSAPGEGDSIGRFVPVDGVIPTTPHLAPTPPHPLHLPEDATAFPEAGVEAPHLAQEPHLTEAPHLAEAVGQSEAAVAAPAEDGPLGSAATAEAQPVEVPGLEAQATEAQPAPADAEPVSAAYDEPVPHDESAPHEEPALHGEPASYEDPLSYEDPAPVSPEGYAESPEAYAEHADAAREFDDTPAAEPSLAPEQAHAAEQAVPVAELNGQAVPAEQFHPGVESGGVPGGPGVHLVPHEEFMAQGSATAAEQAVPAQAEEPLRASEEVVAFAPRQEPQQADPSAGPEADAVAGQDAPGLPGVPAPAGEPVLPAEESAAPWTTADEQQAASVPAPRDGRSTAREVSGPGAGAPADTAAQETGAPAGEPVPDAAGQPGEADPAAADAGEQPAPPRGPAAPAYAEAEREAVLRVIRERRDIRNGFRDDPIPHEVLLRVLEAAHTAPSVGHSQPWDFVVIRSAETRRTMHELAMRQREAYAKSLPKARAKQFKELKVEAILDTPVNIVVTADSTRGGRHTLGRQTQPQMAPYSSALAVENLWLAARAEGLGVGWVSFFDEREMVRALGLPEHLEVVAYLCVGYVDEFPEDPELMQAGWSKRRPLSWVVHEETYGRRALPGEEPHDLLAETVAGIRPLDAKALGEAWERQKRMTKPSGALGMLEIISAQLSGLSRMCPPPVPEPAAVAIFAGDHGVHAQQVTPWPQEVTAQMVTNFLSGGAVCNAFAAQVGAEVCVIDVGVAAELPATPGLLPRKIRAGTADMTEGPALTREEVVAAVEVGIETARDLVAAGNKALLTGEMGIANTTASAALIAVFTDTDPAEVTGRGTGINDETLARKTEVVRRALALHQPDPADPIGVLAAIGGLEHAALVGLLLGGASLRTPVILDGVSAGAAALVARAIAPEALAACIAGHRSAEPGHVAALNKLGLRPLVDLDLRLGEGTGALLALPVVQSAARAMHEVATFDSAGVTEK
ncbi:nicotinate-nucleotide--dimethylbenzimidazole phosphoribosyltransferase [Streptomyces physcomitrii]|uniref:Nicotinate-nucleotide--dimethylbenzimidazole phosphoribosyltransferase n=1 Tax=Streptomyces physcomitrii TaxID=2724184 RepID=A0ABX1H9X8_9ACTN|nr:nicotinate-nucleotide--dimethylbenzimidazole phosphoribosyltransferase [Streptomyces physcomitrii]NKI44044.1 nicotinate-nucleotide--dimethylbenzimidazole phosphoribosyltransferase [Streptomyces physcomitrii]